MPGESITLYAALSVRQNQCSGSLSGYEIYTAKALAVMCSGSLSGCKTSATGVLGGGSPLGEGVGGDLCAAEGESRNDSQRSF